MFSAKVVHLVAASLLATAGAAHAATSHPLVLTAYINGPAGRMLVDGQYEAALGVLSKDTQRTHMSETMVTTNLCVAYTAQKDFAKAKVACDAAVAAAKAEKPFTNSDLYGQAQYKESLAVAYANRAVMRWLQKDGVNAAEDLAKAHTLAPKAPFISRNLAALESKRIVQVTTHAN